MSNPVCELPGGLRVPPSAVPLPQQPAPAGLDELVLAGGCFWCTEAVFAALAGVQSVESGYVGGSADTAEYRRVCAGDTGHAEAIRLRFVPEVISAGTLLQIFFAVAHDPTQKDRQGHDRGRQYRSAVFYHHDAERQYVADYIEALNQAAVFAAPIATTLEPLTTFYRAEEYHQRYALRNPWQPYIQAVAVPKMEKLRDYFAAQLKTDED
ncbi:MAG TPA: peptide-methionine (S)-S-oxide reductase MsrA [Permianibacter sp.]|nr:peptide-methionine (S)-S-oxide reductase MsrA [Permianibacter sp.]